MEYRVYIIDYNFLYEERGTLTNHENLWRPHESNLDLTRLFSNISILLIRALFRFTLLASNHPVQVELGLTCLISLSEESPKPSVVYER